MVPADFGSYRQIPCVLLKRLAAPAGAADSFTACRSPRAMGPVSCVFFFGTKGSPSSVQTRLRLAELLHRLLVECRTVPVRQSAESRMEGRLSVLPESRPRNTLCRMRQV